MSISDALAVLADERAREAIRALRAAPLSKPELTKAMGLYDGLHGPNEYRVRRVVDALVRARLAVELGAMPPMVYALDEEEIARVLRQLSAEVLP